MGAARGRAAQALTTDELERLWENTDGRHGPAYYCAGRPRPYLRGVLHLGCACASPLWTGYQLSLCHTPKEAAAALASCLATTYMLGASAAYHRHEWGTVAREALAREQLGSETPEWVVFPRCRWLHHTC